MKREDNLVYISLPVAKILAEKDKRIDELETQNYQKECEIYKLKEKLELAEQELIKDIYDFYGVSRSDY